MVARDRKGRGDRLRVAVLMGGPSSEHEISLQGGANVVAALDPDRFDARPVVITREGAWRMAPVKRKAVRFQLQPAGVSGGRPVFDAHDTDTWPIFEGPWDGLTELKAWGTDIVFPVLHGAFGEDGVVQACLNAAGLAYVGSGHRASALAFDKVRTKEVLGFHGILTPAWEVVTTEQLTRHRSETIDGWIERLGLPLVLKNPLGGSSLEVHVVKDAGEAATALDHLVPPADRVLVEAFIDGRELTAGIIEDLTEGGVVSLPIVEICVRNAETFDYFEKYSADGAEELCPAPIADEIAGVAQAIALDVHRILGLSGLSRSDFRMTPDGKLWFLEVNTLPGMTDRGLLPLAASHVGFDFQSLIATLVRTAASRD